MSAILVPLLIAVLPLVGVAILQFILPVLGPLLTSEVARPPEAYGWIGGSIGFGTILFLLCNHAILPVLGPLRTLRLGLLMAIVGMGLMLLGTWPAMMAGAAFIGFGYGTTTPAGSQVLADFTPRHLWGTMFSLRQAAVPIGGVIAGAMGSLLVADHGWRLALQVVMLICGTLAAVLLLVPRKFNESRPLAAFEIGRLFDANNVTRPVRTVRSIRGLPSLVVVGWALAFVHATVTSFFVIFLTSGVGLPLTRSAFLFAIVQGCAVFGRILFGAIADWLGSPVRVLRLLAPMSACSAVMLANIAADWGDAIHMLAAATIGMTVGTWNGLYLAEVARLAPAAEVGEATAGSSVFTFTAYLLAPPVVGWMIPRFGYDTTFELVASAALFALAVLLARDRGLRSGSTN